jgi:hypothetical protein
MPATLYFDDFRQNPLLKEFFDKVELRGEQRGIKLGEQRGELKILSRQLKKRFGDIPDWAQVQLQEADIEQLENWSDKLLEVERLEDLFINEI